MIRVTMVDDHTMFREGIRRMFSGSADIRVTQESGSIAEFHSEWSPDACDVVLLDLCLNDGNGLDLIKVAKACASSPSVIVLSTLDHVRHVMQAIEEGADGYVVKGMGFSVLKDAVRTVARGETYICSAVSPQLVERLSRQWMGEGVDGLSQREFRVLVLTAAGLSLKEIGSDLNISDKTVSTYRSRMMTKLELGSTADLVRYALRHGLIE
jgi:two-component system invasion response regulator UvrY